MAHETQQDIHHPSTKQYVLIAIILFAITIVEFLLIWDRVGIQDDVELLGLYWHFVDIVWIVIFTLLYLIGGFDAGPLVPPGG